jgi:hypothetical protein
MQNQGWLQDSREIAQMYGTVGSLTVSNYLEESINPYIYEYAATDYRTIIPSRNAPFAPVWYVFIGINNHFLVYV